MTTSAPRPFASGPRDGAVFSALGDVYRVCARGEDTGGALCAVEARVPPGGGPPPHVHAREAESFFVLGGEVTFFTAAGPRTGGPGTFVHLPAGVPHTFRNEGPGEARLLILCAPAGFERMVADMGARVADFDAPTGRPTPAEIARVQSVCPGYGITFVERL